MKKVVPKGTRIVTTADRYDESESKTNGIILSDKLGQIKDVQTIISASEYTANRGIKEGDLVSLSYDRYKKVKQKKDESLRDTLDEVYKNVETINIPTILLDGKEVLMLDESDVLFVITEYEYYDDEPIKSETKFEIPKLITNI